MKGKSSNRIHNKRKTIANISFLCYNSRSCWCGSVGRAADSESAGREFKSRHQLQKASIRLSFSFVADFGLRPVPTARTRSPRVALAYVSELTGFTITLISFATNLATSSKNGKHCLAVLLFTSSLLFLTLIVADFRLLPVSVAQNLFLNPNCVWYVIAQAYVINLSR